MTTKVDDIMKEKFLCQSRFAEEVEKIAKVNNFNYIDAIVTFCEENKIELDAVSKLISKPCLLYTSPSPRDLSTSRMPSSA